MSTTEKEKMFKVQTPPFRVSFPSVFQKHSYKGSEPKYSVTMIFDVEKFSEADKEKYKNMRKLLSNACKEKFGKKIKDMGSSFKRGLRQGSEKSDLEGYGEPGIMFAVAASKKMPGVVDRDKIEIGEEDFYGGCYARATVSAYAYDNVGKGVAFGLHNIQKLGDGEDFTGRTNAKDDFADDADDVWADDSEVEDGDVDELDDDDDDTPF